MAKKGVFSLPMVKRMFTSIVLGLAFGLLCAYLASMSSTDPTYWGSAMMWNLIFNRFLIGITIAFAGFIQVHPILKIRMYPALRGALLGFIVSLDISFGPFIAGMENAWQIFWATTIIGAVYGIIIDLTASKVGGEGEMLLEGTREM